MSVPNKHNIAMHIFVLLFTFNKHFAYKKPNCREGPYWPHLVTS